MQIFRAGEVAGGRWKKGLYGRINRCLEKGEISWSPQRWKSGPHIFLKREYFLTLSELGLTRNRLWWGSKTRRYSHFIYPVEDKVSLPFWFLSKEKTTYVTEKEFLWEIFETSSFKVLATVSVFVGQQDPKLHYRHRGRFFPSINEVSFSITSPSYGAFMLDLCQHAPEPHTWLERAWFTLSWPLSPLHHLAAAMSRWSRLCLWPCCCRGALEWAYPQESFWML